MIVKLIIIYDDGKCTAGKFTIDFDDDLTFRKSFYERFDLVLLPICIWHGCVGRNHGSFEVNIVLHAEIDQLNILNFLCTHKFGASIQRQLWVVSMCKFAIDYGQVILFVRGLDNIFFNPKQNIAMCKPGQSRNADETLLDVLHFSG
jgi:hypothetical protein